LPGGAAGADATYRESVAIYRGLLPRFEGQMGIVLLNLGSLLASKGDYEEAIDAVVRHRDGAHLQSPEFLQFAERGEDAPIMLDHVWEVVADEPEAGVRRGST
jgi:hypothetical protein